MTKQYCFLKSQRLLASSEFQAVRGTRLTVSTPNVLILAKKNIKENESASTLNGPRLGLAISKRNVKLAAQRNVIKRIARESFRHQAARTDHPLADLDIVLMARPGVTSLTKSELRLCIDELWQQLAKRAQHSVSS